MAAVRIPEGSPTHLALRFLWWAAIAAAAYAAPQVLDRVGLGKLTDALIVAIAAVGLNLLVGFTGQISIGHSAFYGIGAYATAILVVDHGWSAGWTMWVGMAVAFVVGVLVGLPALRLKGVYLALVTLALAVAFPSILKRFESITGGSAGIKNVKYLPPDWTPFDGRAERHLWFYWLAVVALLGCWLVARNLIKSRMGRAMIAVRDNETAARIMGVDVAVTKTVVFGLSAAMAALAGSIATVKLGLVEPDNITLILAIQLLVAMVIGGAASTSGPLIGALVFVYGRDVAKTFGENHSIQGLGDVTFAVLLIAIVFLAPNGVVGLVRSLRSKLVVISPRPPVGEMQLADAPPNPATEKEAPTHA